MEGSRVIQSIAVDNLLSYGSEGVALELQPLNVIIGPNASGKSNFLEAFRLLQAAPQDISKPIISGGGINQWMWKGKPQGVIANISIYLHLASWRNLHHRFAFQEITNHLYMISETIELIKSVYSERQLLYHNVVGRAQLSPYINNDNLPVSKYGEPITVRMEDLSFAQSILAQRSDPMIYPDLSLLANTYKKIAMYADVNFGRNTPARQPQKADLDSTYLFEDGSNLALVINDLQNRPGVMRDIIARFKKFNPRVQDIITRVSYGTVQIFIEEEGLQQTLPATRLSDGTLRYLFLLVLLCHPEPPPIICIEEPELGLHPDMIRSIAELLLEASQRTQIILTTHSDLLVSALSETPEAIVICEHDGDSSTLRRLEPDKLNLWLEKYSLGELWLKGEIGGTRW